MSRVECHDGGMSLRHAVLGMLADEPASGYDLLKRFERAMANVWPATQSQLYGELGKLESAGMIHVQAEGPRGRKEYEITDAGLAELRHWLIEVDPGGPPRSEGLLRVYFLGSVSPEQARGYVATMGEAGGSARSGWRSWRPRSTGGTTTRRSTAGSSWSGASASRPCRGSGRSGRSSRSSDGV